MGGLDGVTGGEQRVAVAQEHRRVGSRDRDGLSVAFHRGLDLVLRELRDGPRRVRGGTRRLRRGVGFAFAQGLARAAGFNQRVDQRLVRRRQCRIEPQRLAQALDSSIRVTLLAQEDAVVMVRGGALGCGACACRKRVTRASDIAQPGQRAATGAHCRG